MNDRTIYDLMRTVSRRLVKKPVDINFVNYSTLKAAGCARVDYNGRYVIDLASDIYKSGSEEDLKAFLHECAHLRLHAKNFGKSDTSQPPEWDKPKNEVIAGRRLLMESQAETLAATWEHYAIEHEPKDENGSSLFELRLRALLKY